MSDLPPGFTLDKRSQLNDDELPAGFKLDAVSNAKTDPVTAALLPTGQLHDGDTFTLKDGRNARLFGVDAFELAQNGRRMDGSVVPLGLMARNALAPFAQSDATVLPTGAMTYGRPVATLSNGEDAGQAILDRGLGLAAPRYLAGATDRLAAYMEAERLARLNRRGAHGLTYQTPASARAGNPDPWQKAEWSSTPGEGKVAVFADEATPFQGLRKDVADGYIAIWQDMRSRPDDLVAYAKRNGFSIDPVETSKQYAARDRDQRAGSAIGYKAPPKLLTDVGDGRLGATARGVADPLNLLDELGAVVDTVGLTPGRENLWSSDRRFGDILANNLDQNRSILANDEANYPWWRFGGQLAGGVALPGAAVEGVGFSAARAAIRAGASRMAARAAAKAAVTRRLATAGAVEGGVAGTGQGETVGERVQGLAIGAPAGAFLGASAAQLAPLVARGATAVGNAVGRPFRRPVGVEGEAAIGSAANGSVDASKAVASNELLTPARGGPGGANTLSMAATYDAPTLDAPALDDPVARARLALEADSLVERVRAGSAEEAFGFSDPIVTPAPRDLLPLPANTLSGVDEAAGIERGRYQPVRAPDEREELGRHDLPSPREAWRNLPKRGPVDLVTWLRSMGGVREDSGHLKFVGIDNKPRTMDFATGENRFGPLVNENGMGFDEAAELAHEAGFFPDHVERPTIREFIDALEGTHTGRNRVFRPDDYAEIDRFEAARRDRYAVESALEKGAPLNVDRSQPVDMADLDRNAAPVETYEEWGENAPNLAGNIRLDKLDSPQAIKRALVETARVSDGFDAARRGRITQAETKSLANDLGMTVEDLLSRRKGQAFNAEQALAARQLLARSGNDLVKLANRVSRFETPGDELEAQFRETWLRHAAIQEQVAGMTAEAGRLLGQFRMVANSLDSQALPSLGNIIGGSGRLKDVAERIVDLEKVGTTPAGINRYALKSLLPQWRDKGVELYINSLLSGPQTHAVNILSNTLTSLAQLPEYAAGAAVGSVRRLLPGQANTDRVLFSELGSRAVGMMTGAKEGMRLAARAFMTGDAVDAVTKVESQQQKAIAGPLGSFIRTPTRALTAEDEFFKSVATRMELAGLAMRQARKEGLVGADAKARAADLLLSPPDDMLKRAMDFARYVTFQTPLAPDSLAAGVSRYTQRQPIAKLLFPFVRTPMNLLKFAVERSPAAPIMKSYRREIAAGGARRDLAIARATVGTGVMAAVYEMAAGGLITGGGPPDDGARRLMQADGWQPYSLKIGDRYYSYSRLDPFSTTIGTMADLVDMKGTMTDAEQEASWTLVGAAILNNLSSKTWLTGISSALEAVNDPDRYLNSYLSRTAGAVAVPSFVAQIARTSDPVLREARTPIDAIKRRIPGLSQTLPARRDIFGELITSEGGVGPDAVTPVWTTTGRNDPLVSELLGSGVSIRGPQRHFKRDGKRLEWTPAQYDQFQKMAGGETKVALDRLLGSVDWQVMDDEQRQEAVSKITKRARANAKDAILDSLTNSMTWSTDPIAEALAR